MAKRISPVPLQERAALLTARLAFYGLDNHDLTLTSKLSPHFPGPTPQKAAQRMLALLGVSMAAYNFEESDKIMEWLKKEEIWKETSASEKEFFRAPNPTEEYKASFSWKFEAAYQLAWTLDSVTLPTEPIQECNEEHAHDFFSHAPTIGSPAKEFWLNACFRKAEEIEDEYVFYEQVNAYLADMIANQKENTSGIQAKASLERLAALRWLAGYKGKTEWDEITAEEEEEA